MLFLLLFPFLLLAQQTAVPFGAGPNGIVKCATVEHMNQLRATYPNLPSDTEFESWLQDKIAEQERNGTGNSRMVLTIPVVFHILHDGDAVGTGLNLSVAQIQSQLDVLNEDFRRTPGTPGFNNDIVGADAEIEFCMAFWDPNQQVMAEPGINRIHLNSMNWPAFPHRMRTMEDTIKPQSSWDPSKYFNIWVTDLASNNPGFILLGYAQFPSGNVVTGIPFSGGASTDGVAIRHSVCGRVGRAQGNSDQGRTLTHEIGHWLGLRHIWGDGGCGVDDFCNDTPESDDSNSGCNPNHISCGSVDMVQNYMDYTRGTCQNIFTQCQSTRMRAVLQNAVRRSSLLTSTVCEGPTTTPISAFGFRNQNTCDGLVSFMDSSENIPIVWYWTFGDGMTSTQRNPTHTYSASGVYTVRLITNNSFGTNVTDQQISVHVSSHLNVDAGPDLIACAGDSVQLNTALRDSTATLSWLPTSSLSDPTIPNPRYYALIGRTFWVIATDSVGCVSRDTLSISTVPRPTLDAGSDVTIQWGDSITLNPILSKPAASLKWTPPLAFRTAGGDTSLNPIIKPTLTTRYHLMVTDTDGCTVQDSLVVTVEGGPPASISGLVENIGIIHLPYPNPAQDKLIFTASFKQAIELKLRIFDLTGRPIATITQEKLAPGVFSTTWKREEQIASGLYFVVWQLAGRRVVQKIQLK